MLLMHASEKRRASAVGAGQLCALLGLKETRTGGTLSHPEHPLLLAGLPIYEPVITQAIEPAALRDREPLLEALARVADEDPSFRFGEDEQTGQLVVSGIAAKRAGPVLLEPFMRLEVVVPVEHVGEVLGGLDQRRARILDLADRGTAARVLQCDAPLRRMFGYATELRSRTQGRAVFTMRFDRFDSAS